MASVMTPRHEVAWIGVDSDRTVIEAHLARYPYSRFLVCENSVDKVLGMVHTRDLLSHTLAGQPPNLEAVLSQPLFVPEGLPVLKLLERFRSHGVHLAVVTDEYGGTEGVVTLTDVLEGLVGEMSEVGEAESAAATQREDGSWLLDGLLEIDEVANVLKIDMETSHSYRTLGGFVMTQLRRIPSPSDSFTAYGWRFEVVDMDGKRVDKVLASSIHILLENPTA